MIPFFCCKPLNSFVLVEQCARCSVHGLNCLKNYLQSIILFTLCKRCTSSLYHLAHSRPNGWGYRCNISQTKTNNNENKSLIKGKTYVNENAHHRNIFPTNKQKNNKKNEKNNKIKILNGIEMEAMSISKWNILIWFHLENDKRSQTWVDMFTVVHDSNNEPQKR